MAIGGTSKEKKKETNEQERKASNNCTDLSCDTGDRLTHSKLTSESSSCTESSSSSSSSCGGQPSSVRFGTIQIRNYNIVLSDNPSCQEGPGISLGWKYSDCGEEISIEDFEAFRKGKRLHQMKLIMSPSIRWRLLELWDVSDEEIKKTIDEREVIQKQRFETMQQEKKKIERRKRIKSVLENMNLKFKMRA